MPVEYFVRYKGQRYDVGTKLKFVIGTGIFQTIHEGTIEWIDHYSVYIRLVDGRGWELSKLFGLENTIVEIVKPVYYIEPPKKPVKGGPLPSEDAIFVGWAWYIIIMAVGLIFNDRWLIWFWATLIFFNWKNGFFNGGKK